MRLELFIASKLRLGNPQKKGAPSLNVALVGIVLAIVIMILSIVIVLGFKKEITTKIYSLDSHLKVSNAVLGIDNNFSSVNRHDIVEQINADKALRGQVESMSLIIEKPAILKTDENFKGLVFRGVDSCYNWRFIEDHLSEGRVPDFSETANINEVVISSTVARELGLKTGDKIFTYFIDDKVKMRNSLVVGVFNTDFDTHDKAYMLGNIGQLQGINGWDEDQGNYVGINVKNLDNVDNMTQEVFSALAIGSYNDSNSTTIHNVSATTTNNMQFFTWLQMLDTNVVIILVLMMIVTGFTLIAALLMIVLERIRMIGLLKALGATNGSIRRVFIYLTGKLILKALLLGDVVGIGLALIQKYFHILKLDPESYYMSYVPVSIDIPSLVLLNIAILVVSYLTLIAPSYIISSIRPTSTMRFE